VPLLRECYVSRLHHQALEDCAAALHAKFDAYYQSQQRSGLVVDSDWQDQPFESFVRQRCIIGDAAFVYDEMQRYREMAGVTHFLLRVQWPGLVPEKAMQSINILGDKVIPRLG
jgi:hypothetical protein